MACYRATVSDRFDRHLRLDSTEPIYDPLSISRLLLLIEVFRSMATSIKEAPGDNHGIINLSIQSNPVHLSVCLSVPSTHLCRPFVGPWPLFSFLIFYSR
jgi:hypothetical protein